MGDRCPECNETLSADGNCWSCDWGPAPDDLVPRAARASYLDRVEGMNPDVVLQARIDRARAEVE